MHKQDNYLHIIFVFCLNYFIQLSRILWGLAFDKIGYKKCCIIIGICVTIGISSLPLLLFLGKKCQGTRKKYVIFLLEMNSPEVKILWSIAIVLVYLNAPGIYSVSYFLKGLYRGAML